MLNRTAISYSLSVLLSGTLLAASFFLISPNALVPHIAEAATTNLSGYAWSDTIGWISFNCSNDNTCGVSPYKVTLDTTTNYLTGFAWSENIGWIQFGGLSGCPVGSCAAQRSGGTLSGWARAVNGDGTTASPVVNGTDGWISLSSTNGGGGTYGVSIGTSELDGYAWGSDVVGWISMNCKTGGPTGNDICATSNYQVSFPPPCATVNVCSADHSQSINTDSWCAVTATTCSAGFICKDAGGLCGNADPSGTMTFANQKVRKGATTNVSWSILYYDTCTILGTNGDTWTWASATPATMPHTTAALQNESTYTLNCTPIKGGAAVLLDTKKVTLIPTIKLF